MPSGGKRPRAGRPPGSKNKVTRERQAAILASGLAPLDYMLAILRDEGAPMEVRFEAAKAAAPYVHPRLAAIEHSGEVATPYVARLPEPAKDIAEWRQRHVPPTAAPSTVQ